MSVSIVSCPSCHTLVLNDTAQCPNCQLILDTERMAELDALQPGRRSASPASEAEEPCARCGEMVRKGLVRCWNCGEFMRGDIAQVYEKMQASDSPVIYSRIPNREISASGSAAATSAEDQSPSLYARDEDFELSPEFSMQAPESRKPHAPAAQAAATTPEVPASEASEDAAERRAEAAEGESVSHSVATGGEVLLQVALQEEAEVAKRPKAARRGPRAMRGFLVYCPNGHRIEVLEHHRGRAGRCPRCKSPFYVPFKEEVEQQPATAGGQAAGAAPQSGVAAGQYTRWMSDVHFHAVNPQKLKLKPGSLQNEFEEREVGFSPEGMLTVTLSKKKGGLFGGGDKKKKDAAREAVFEHLRAGNALDKLPAGGHRLYNADQMKQVGMAQPFPYAHESLFAGIPVFGDGRIAVKFPKTDDAPELHYASFFLSQFRQFAAAMAEFYGVIDLGAEFGVPLTDQFEEMTCHYSDEKLQVLQNLEFYKADPVIKLKLIGRKCQACGLVVSEDSRKKEKIGGANGKGIAKAKCPKCSQKFGDISLFTLDRSTDEAPQENPAEVPKEKPAEPAAAT